MKNQYLFFLLNIFLTTFSVNRHFRGSCKNLKQSLNNSIDKSNSDKDLNFYHYKEYVIPKILFEFIDLSAVTCVEFLTFIIDNYAFEIKKDQLKNIMYTLSPEDAWNMLHSSDIFDGSFITMIDEIYNKDEFILIYKTRLTIEYIVFAFNIKEKSTKFQYTYLINADLKKILHNLLDFINHGSDLLENKLTEVQIEEVKKFLRKHIGYKSINHMTFLNELKSFKYFIDIFFDKNNNINFSFNQQLSMINRFMTIFK